MSPREQIIYLLKHYYDGNYEVDTFAEEFYRIYNFEVNDCELSQRERSLLFEVFTVVSRFSPHKEDLKATNTYFGEQIVKEKATRAYLELFKRKA